MDICPLVTSIVYASDKHDRQTASSSLLLDSLLKRTFHIDLAVYGNNVNSCLHGLSFIDQSNSSSNQQTKTSVLNLPRD